MIVTVNPELFHHHYFYLHNTAVILHMVSVLQVLKDFHIYLPRLLQRVLLRLLH